MISEISNGISGRVYEIWQQLVTPCVHGDAPAKKNGEINRLFQILELQGSLDETKSGLARNTAIGKKFSRVKNFVDSIESYEG